jgi:hypothetical protein
MPQAQSLAELSESPVFRRRWPSVYEALHIDCDKLGRLRSNLYLRTAPPPYRGHGRPAVYGRKFKFRDARTWGTPTETLHLSDAELGQVTIRRWDKLHFQKAAQHPLTVIRIECDAPPLADWWRLYFRRFAGDHWYRFAKQSLYWTRPRLKTPEQAERWSALMPVLTWQLWLARPIVCDKPRPWQKGQMSERMTPGRVRARSPRFPIARRC